ncbi:MAG: hypothetical protein JNL70_07435 [Saprospiraceae bacterium]|nr:hypothetical protein [Saprospiraceae bacterium]
MFKKLVFPALFMAFLGQNCDSKPQNAANSEPTSQTDSLPPSDIRHTEGVQNAQPCDAILTPNSPADLQKIYSDTLAFAQQSLLFVTRDSALSVFKKAENRCSLLLKIPIDNTDLYGYTDGSPLFLSDIDGDKQKEVFVTVEKNGGHSKFRIYRLMTEGGDIRLKKIEKMDELINPEYDIATGMIRSHWYERGDFEQDEYYRISKNDVLQFVKGLERRGDKEKTYTTKQGW